MQKLGGQQKTVPQHRYFVLTADALTWFKNKLVRLPVSCVPCVLSTVCPSEHARVCCGSVCMPGSEAVWRGLLVRPHSASLCQRQVTSADAAARNFTERVATICSQHPEHSFILCPGPPNIKKVSCRLLHLQLLSCDVVVVVCGCASGSSVRMLTRPQPCLCLAVLVDLSRREGQGGMDHSN